MKEWKTYPKPEPKPKKKFGYAYWNGIKKKSFEKKKNKMKTTADKDVLFYKWVWNHSDKCCAECGKKLQHPNTNDARNFIHHILPKSNNPYFRHDPKNVIILCWSDHGKAESVISYPKMVIYTHCEKTKKKLLESVGLIYSQPTL